MTNDDLQYHGSAKDVTDAIVNLNDVRNAMNKAAIGPDERRRLSLLYFVQCAISALSGDIYGNSPLHTARYAKRIDISCPDLVDTIETVYSNEESCLALELVRLHALLKGSDVSDIAEITTLEFDYSALIRKKGEVLQAFETKAVNDLKKSLNNAVITSSQAKVGGRIRGSFLGRLASTMNFIPPNKREAKLKELPLKSVHYLVFGEPSFEEEDRHYAKGLFHADEDNDEQLAISILSCNTSGGFFKMDPTMLYVLLSKRPDLKKVVDDKIGERTKRRIRLAKRGMKTVAIGAAALAAVNVFPDVVTTAARDHIVGVNSGTDPIVLNDASHAQRMRYRMLLAKLLTTPIVTAHSSVNAELQNVLGRLEPADHLTTIGADNYQSAVDFYMALGDFPNGSRLQTEYIEQYNFDSSIRGPLTAANYKERLAVFQNMLEYSRAQERSRKDFLGKDADELADELFDFNFDIMTPDGASALGDAAIFLADIIDNVGDKFVYKKIVYKKILSTPSVRDALRDGLIKGDLDKLLILANFSSNENYDRLRFLLPKGIVVSDIHFPSQSVTLDNLQEMQSQVDILAPFMSQHTGGRRRIYGYDIEKAYLNSLDFSALPHSIASDDDLQAVQGVVAEISSKMFLRTYLDRVRVDQLWRPDIRRDSYGNPNSLSLNTYLNDVFQGLKLTDMNQDMWSEIAKDMSYHVRPETFDLDYDHKTISSTSDLKAVIDKINAYDRLAPEFGVMYYDGSSLDFASDIIATDMSTMEEYSGLLLLHPDTELSFPRKNKSFASDHNRRRNPRALLAATLRDACVQALIDDDSLDMDDKIQRLEYVYWLASAEWQIPSGISRREAYEQIRTQYTDRNYTSSENYNRDKGLAIISCIDMSQSLPLRLTSYESAWGGTRNNIYSEEVVSSLFGDDKLLVDTTSADMAINVSYHAQRSVSLKGYIEIDDDYWASVHDEESYAQCGELWPHLTESQKNTARHKLHLEGEIQEETAPLIRALCADTDQSHLEGLSLPILSPENHEWVLDIAKRLRPNDHASGPHLRIGNYPSGLNSSDDTKVAREIKHVMLLNYDNDDAYKNWLRKMNRGTHISGLEVAIQILAEDDYSPYSESPDLTDDLVDLVVDKTTLKPDDLHRLLEIDSLAPIIVSRFIDHYLDSYNQIDATETQAVLTTVANLYSGYVNYDVKTAIIHILRRLDLSVVDLKTAKGRRSYALMYDIYNPRYDSDNDVAFDELYQ